MTSDIPQNFESQTFRSIGCDVTTHGNLNYQYLVFVKWYRDSGPLYESQISRPWIMLPFK